MVEQFFSILSYYTVTISIFVLPPSDHAVCPTGLSNVYLRILSVTTFQLTGKNEHYSLLCDGDFSQQYKHMLYKESIVMSYA